MNVSETYAKELKAFLDGIPIEYRRKFPKRNQTDMYEFTNWKDWTDALWSILAPQNNYYLEFRIKPIYEYQIIYSWDNKPHQHLMSLNFYINEEEFKKGKEFDRYNNMRMISFYEPTKRLRRDQDLD